MHASDKQLEKYNIVAIQTGHAQVKRANQIHAYITGPANLTGSHPKPLSNQQSTYTAFQWEQCMFKPGACLWREKHTGDISLGDISLAGTPLHVQSRHSALQLCPNTTSVLYCRETCKNILFHQPGHSHPKQPAIYLEYTARQNRYVQTRCVFVEGKTHRRHITRGGGGGGGPIKTLSFATLS